MPVSVHKLGIDLPRYRPVRIVVHDYSGHAFPVQLSRALATRGHTLLHLYSTDFETPKGGRLQTANSDSSGLTIRGLSIGERLRKESFFKRRRQERAFGRTVAREILSFSPDVVISSNAPLDSQAAIVCGARAANSAFVFWLQDLYGEAIQRILDPNLASLAGRRSVVQKIGISPARRQSWGGGD